MRSDMPSAKKSTAKKATAKAPAAKKSVKKPAGGKTASTSAATKAKATRSPSSLIDERIDDLGDWRGDVLAKVRTLIHQAVPDVVEDWKWRGVPTWEHEGIITTGESYKEYVKFTFPKGASLPTRPDSSTRVSRATPGAPSTCTGATR